MARDDRGDGLARHPSLGAPGARDGRARGDERVLELRLEVDVRDVEEGARERERRREVARGDHPVGVRVEDAEERRVQRLVVAQDDAQALGEARAREPELPADVEEMVDDVADERLAVRRHVAQARGAHPEGRAAGDAGVTRGGRRPARAFSSGAPTRPKFRDR